LHIIYNSCHHLFSYKQIKRGADKSFEFLKTNSQLLEISLQTLLPSFFRNQFLETIAKTSFYKKKPIYPNRTLTTADDFHLSYLEGQNVNYTCMARGGIYSFPSAFTYVHIITLDGRY
jgi:hypothetical protein